MLMVLRLDPPTSYVESYDLRTGTFLENFELVPHTDRAGVGDIGTVGHGLLVESTKPGGRLDIQTQAYHARTGRITVALGTEWYRAEHFPVRGDLFAFVRRDGGQVRWLHVDTGKQEYPDLLLPSSHDDAAMLAVPDNRLVIVYGRGAEEGAGCGDIAVVDLGSAKLIRRLTPPVCGSTPHEGQ